MRLQRNASPPPSCNCVCRCERLDERRLAWYTYIVMRNIMLSPLKARFYAVVSRDNLTSGEHRSRLFVYVEER